MTQTLLCWIWLLLWCSMSESPLKAESCNDQPYAKKISEIQNIIMQVYGEKEGTTLIEKVKESPHVYANDERPIIVQLSNVFVDNKICAFNARDTYNQMRKSEKQIQELTNKINKLEKAIKKEEISLVLQGNWVAYSDGYQLPKADKIGKSFCLLCRLCC
eukprot:UN07678